jgi:hypothetical protein
MVGVKRGAGIFKVNAIHGARANPNLFSTLLGVPGMASRDGELAFDGGPRSRLYLPRRIRECE